MDRATADVRALDVPSDAPLALPLAGADRDAVRALALGVRRAVVDGQLGDLRALGAALAAQVAAPVPDGHRAVLVLDAGATHEDLLEVLEALVAGRPDPRLVQGEPRRDPGATALVFPGQGAQWPGMGSLLREQSPVFDEAMARSLSVVAEEHPAWPDDALDSVERLRAVEVVQPALFAVQTSLAELWRAHGVEVDLVVGHSIGELAAAQVAGAFSPADGARAAARWSRAMMPLVGVGDMASVGLALDDVRARLARWQDPDLEVAGVNGPTSVLLAGDPATVRTRVAQLRDEGVRAQVIAVEMAAHSRQVDAVAADLAAAFTGLEPAPLDLPFVSSVAGGRVEGPYLTGAHWARCFREPVRYDRAVEVALAEGAGTFVEVSPHPVLAAVTRQVVEAEGSAAQVVSTLQRDVGGLGRFLHSLAQVWVGGTAVDWSASCSDVEPSAVPVPAPLGDLPRTDGGLAQDGRGPAPSAPHDVVAVVRAEAATVAGRAVRSDETFLEMGLDSVLVAQLRTQLAAALGRDLPITWFYDFPTPGALGDALAGAVDRPAPHRPAPASRHDDEPIAVVAMACRLPGGVATPEDFWEVLSGGRDVVDGLPADRGWDVAALLHPDTTRSGTTVQRSGGFLRAVADFDPAFFGLSPREALATDPQQRVLLELSWEVLERAGIAPDSLRATRTGVFVGLIPQEYGPRLADGGRGVEGYLMTGTTSSVASGRIAYTLGLEGPALTVDTACSSSLAAVHLACASLRRGETPLALVGGATIMPTPGMLVDFSRMGSLAPDGRSKAFSAAADGFGMAEGAGMVVLERLSDARRHGHPVLAVVRGTAMNSDGASNGLSAPNGRAQVRVVRDALADAGIAAADVDVVEAHGTGTRLGDPIEASALQDAYGDGRQRPLLLGSVKSNIGHTQAAAGVVGLMKLVLALNHDLVPPTLHAAEPSTEIDWSEGVLELVQRPTPWQRGERPRRAGVSSFGISGTNVHAVLEEAPGPASSTTTSHRGPAAFPWVLSGASREAVGAQAARLADHLEEHPQLDPVDVARTLATGRSPLGHRVGLVSSPERVVESLRAVADGTSRAASGVVDGVARPVFVFPGQGWQWAGMAVELLDTTPVFAQAMRECARALRPHLDLDVVEFLRGEAAQAGSAGALSTERVDHVQPVLFAVMVSLAATWRAQGVEPAAVVGHSQGEIAAACVAGLLTLEDAARIVARRSLAIAAMPRRGAMVSIAAPLEEVRARLGDRLDVASVNSPSSVVVAGDRDVLDLLVAECAADGIRTTRLPVDYASHSRHVDDIEGEVLEGLSPAPRPLPGAVPMLSTVTGRWVGPGDLGPRYWFDNLRSTVRFSDAVQSLVDGGWGTFVEISAHPILTTAVEQTAEAHGHDVVTISTLRRGHGGPDELASSLARAFVAGVPVDWRETFRGSGAVPVQLPTYPFERRRVWWSPSSGDGAGAAPPDPRSYRIAWHPGAIDPHARLRGTWVLLHRPDLKQSFLATAEEALARRGARVERWAVPPGGAEQEVAAGLEGTSDVTGMVSLLAVDASEDAGSPLSSPVIDDLLGAVRAVVASDSSARLWWVTSGAVATSPHERLRTLGHGASWAIGRIVGLENPTVWGGLMDLPGIDAEDAVAQLGAVLAADDGEDHLALRLSGPWVRRWVRVTTPATQQWRPRGTVLVTGATGGVGRQVARWLASRGAQRLVLLSRSGPQAEGAGDLVRELEVAGAQVDLRACDVADRDALEQVLSDIGDDLPLSSVFHAAATLDDAVVTELTAERIERSNRAKVLGALHLDALTRDVELDDFVLFSSFASAFGTPGLGGYAPGNAVLDALAHERRRVGRPAMSVSWGTWAGGGMAEGPVAERFRRHGVLQMDPRDATASLVSALDRADAAPLVMEIEWRRFVAAYTALRPTRLFDDLAERGPDAVQAARTADEPARGGRPADRDAVTALVRDRVADVLGHESADAIDVDQPFARLGVDSLSALELRNALGATTGVRLPTTIVFDHPTVRRLAAHLAEQLGLSEQSVGPERESVERDDEDPIVVVGMGCRLPGGVDGPESLWDLVVDGATTATDAPDDRSWTVEELARGGVARGNFMDGAGDFDAAFFGISPREALAMDPQQRHALQSVWETLEHAGIAPDSLRGTRTGVFVGHSHQGYGTGAVQDGGDLEGYRLTGTTASVVSGRVAYVLGLEGPAITVDTACSSSLVALHLAVGALRSGECDLAVAGGVSVMAGPEVFVEFSRQGALAADGRCKPFSAAADGFGLGEGSAFVAVQRLSVARREGRRVWAVVAGSAVNQDGASNGLAAPSGVAQQRVIREAWARAGVGAGDVGVVEAHGTGTRLGDPVEASAVLATYGRGRGGAGPVLLGSVKSNVGHAQAAAGVAGLIKVVMGLSRGVVGPSVCVGGRSELVDWSAGEVELAEGLREWPVGADGVRRAGVSAFGISGTNAHVVVEQAPVVEEPVVGAGSGVLGGAVVPLVLSARTPQALARLAAATADTLAGEDAPVLADAAWTLATGRARLPHRAVVTVEAANASARLRALVDGVPSAHVAATDTSGTRSVAEGPVMVFPGQGAQWVGMASGLLGVEVFASALAEVDAALGEVLDFSVREVLEGREGAPSLDRVEVVQPALFAVMVSLARWWESVGVRPAAVVGHSQGEIAAAVVAGALSVADGARVVARRALALRALAGRGAMAVLRADADTVERLLQDGRWAGDVEVAAENARDAVVVSGGVDAVAEVVEAVEARGVRATHVAVDYASHSAHVEELRDELLGQLADISPRDAQVPLFSTTLRRPVEGTELDAGYWYENLRRRVHLRTAIEALAREGHSAFLEVSPHPVLTAAVAETVSETGVDAAVLDTLERDVEEVDRLQRAAGAAYAAGLDVDWRALVRPAQVVPLPTYPFEQRRYWLAPRRPEQVRDPIADWFLTETWTSVPPASPRQVPARWWIVVPDHVPAASWAGPVSEALRVAGTTAATVTLADLADEVGPGDGILSLLAVGSGDVSSTLALLARVQDHRGPVWVATTAAVVVADEDAGRVRPDQASVRALGQVAGLERGAAWTGLVDLPADTGPAGPAPQDVEAVVAAVLGAEDQVAVRDGQVRARRLVPCEPPPSGQYVPPRGTVVVTGGTSGLGAVTARWLVERGVRSLVLLSRRGPDTPGVDDLVADLQRAGAVVTVQACDVTDRASLRRALSAHDEITGVVHAAGLPQHQALADMDTTSLRRVLDVKATGAALLDELVPEAELFLLFSSGAAVWGSNGQAAYAAGNAALDALARRRHAAGRAASSVAWGLWETGGMTQDAAAVDYLRDRGVTPMVVELALAALDRVLAAGVPNAVVAQVDWPVFAAAYCAARPRPLLDVVRGPAGPGGAPEEPELAEAAGAEDPPGLSAELAPLPAAERRSRLLRLVRVHAAAVLGHDDPATIRPRDSFKQLGFDSLAALRLRDSLQKASGLTLSSTLVYDHADATEVAEYLDGCLAVDEQQETAVPQGDGIASLERELIALEDADRAEAVDRLLGLVERLRAAPATARPELAEVDDDLVDADLDELVAALGRELGDEGAT